MQGPGGIRPFTTHYIATVDATSSAAGCQDDRNLGVRILAPDFVLGLSRIKRCEPIRDIDKRDNPGSTAIGLTDRPADVNLGAGVALETAETGRLRHTKGTDGFKSLDRFLCDAAILFPLLAVRAQHWVEFLNALEQRGQIRGEHQIIHLRVLSLVRVYQQPRNFH